VGEAHSQPHNSSNFPLKTGEPKKCILRVAGFAVECYPPTDSPNRIIFKNNQINRKDNGTKNGKRKIGKT
jgi:hypothetical protein